MIEWLKNKLLTINIEALEEKLAKGLITDSQRADLERMVDYRDKGAW